MKRRVKMSVPASAADWVRPVLIGQSPSQSTDGRGAFSGRCGAFLADLLGVPRLEDVFELRNLLDIWPGKDGRGDAFPMARAREAAEQLLPFLCERKVVLAGRNVARAFGVSIPFLTTTKAVGVGMSFEALLIPHPSGLNTWWNLEANKRSAAAALRAFAGEPDLLSFAEASDGRSAC